MTRFRMTPANLLCRVALSIAEHHPRGKTVNQLHGFDAANRPAAEVRAAVVLLVLVGLARTRALPDPRSKWLPPMVEYVATDVLLAVVAGGKGGGL